MEKTARSGFTAPGFYQGAVENSLDKTANFMRISQTAQADGQGLNVNTAKLFDVKILVPNSHALKILQAQSSLKCRF